MIKTRRTRWQEHKARTNNMRDTYRLMGRAFKERYNLEDLGVDGKIILKWIPRKEMENRSGLG
jgi:hypothetical protein